MAGAQFDQACMEMMGLVPGVFDAPNIYDECESVIVQIERVRGGKKETVDEEVMMDPLRGPKLLLPDGSFTFMPRLRFNDVGANNGKWHHTMDTYRKGWKAMTATEQNVHVHTAARKNRAMKERRGLA